MTIKNYQSFLANDLKDQCIGMGINQKVRMKIQQTRILYNEFITSLNILVQDVIKSLYYEY